VLRRRAIRNRPRDEHERRLMQQAYDIASAVLDFAQPHGIEKIVFDFDIAVAGTIDLLALANDGTVKIVDWKTNEKIERENPYNKFMLGPLCHLADNDFNHYALQLSIYQAILVRRGYVKPGTVITRDIFHIKEDGVEHLSMPFLGAEAYAALLDHTITNIKAPF
jgi:ATP-dependent exoDNAse (exonuclease V) beta subunit